MQLNAFKATLQQDTPPPFDNPLLRALWYDAKGDWDRAHQIAQDVSGPDGDWVHAYLHRVEGDEWNANYWYRRAGRSMPDLSLKEEWAQLVEAFLEREN
jgi:hypothetical protein